MDFSTTASCIHKMLLQAALVRDLGRLERLQILHFLDENFQPPRHGTHATWRHLSPTLPALAIRINAPTNWRGCIGLAPLLYMTTENQELAPPLCGKFAQKKPSIVTCRQTASPMRLRGTQTLQMNEICSRLLFLVWIMGSVSAHLAQEATNWVLGAFLRPNPPNDRTQTGCCSTTHKCGVGRPQWCTDISRVLDLMMNKCGHQFRSDDSQEEVRSVQQERAGVAQKRMHGAPCA